MFKGINNRAMQPSISIGVIKSKNTPIMKNLLLIPALLLCFSASLTAQKWWNSGIDGEGATVEQTLDVRSFEGIKLTMNADVYLTKGSSQSVRISAQQNIIDLIKTDVEDGVWRISPEENIDDHSQIKIYITAASLNYVGLSGSGDIRTEGLFTGNDQVKLAVSGSGDISFNTTAQTVEAAVSGSGDIELEGSARSLTVRISGSGDIDAYNFETTNCEVKVSGSGGAKVHADSNLDVRVSGSGDVYYRGNPNVNSRISGSGDLHASRG